MTTSSRGNRIYINSRAHKSVSNAVLITGTARSGTSIIGTLVHSFWPVEYIFEPPLLYGLFPLIRRLDKWEWCYLYETYLYNDFLLDALAGRRLNMNMHDESSIFQAKSEEEIEKRLQKGWRAHALMEVADDSRIVYKMPDIQPYLAKLLDYYPRMKIIVMSREPETLAGSLRKKGWFTNEALKARVANWPWKNQRGIAIPFWVPGSMEETWRDTNEEGRIRIYLEVMNGSSRGPDPVGYDPGESLLKVPYEDFIADPDAYAQRICEFLGVKYGSITESMVLPRIKAYVKYVGRQGSASD